VKILRLCQRATHEEAQPLGGFAKSLVNQNLFCFFQCSVENVHVRMHCHLICRSQKYYHISRIWCGCNGAAQDCLAVN
jgi:hypothetical protein